MLIEPKNWRRQSILNRVLESDSLLDGVDRYDAFLAAAHVNRLLRRFDEASRRCEEALGAASDKSERLNALYALGTIYRMAGRLTDAREVFQKAIRFGAASFWLVRAYYELGLMERDMGKFAEARAKIRRAIEILQSDPTLLRGQLPELFVLYGHLSYELEDTEEAVRSFQSAFNSSLENCPFHWNSLLWIARCQYDSGQLQSARKSAAQVEQSRFASDEERSIANELIHNIDLSDNRRT
jgi:tetratricopeptide (TPR) repeat protein